MPHPLFFALLALFFSGVFIHGSPIMKKERLSSARDGIGGILVGDLHYFVGGFELNDFIATNITEIYNATSGEWKEPIFLEEPRGYISTALVGQNIYFIGGAQYLSTAMLYNPSTHQYEAIGSGPTVKRAVRVSNHNSTVIVLGYFSADFYDPSNGWHYKPRLTSWMQGVSGEALAVHENFIIGVGGVNTTTLEPLYNAWIYDTNTDNLTVFNNATTATSFNRVFSIVMANESFIMYSLDVYFAHTFGTMEWNEVSVSSISKAVVLNDVAFVFNSSGYSVYDWSTNSANWTASTYQSIIAFQNQLALLRNGFQLDVYEEGSWSSITFIDSVTAMVGWFSKCVLYGPDTDLRVYDSTTRQVTVIPNSKGAWSSILAFDPNTLVLFMTGNALIYNDEAKSFSAAIPVNFTGEFVIGKDVISLLSKVSWVNFNQTFSLNISRSITSEDRTVQFRTASSVTYKKINVYNYVQKTWLPTIDMPLDYSWLLYSPVAVVDDEIIVISPLQTFRLNTTSGETSIVTNESQCASFRTVATTPVVNHVAYVPGLNVSSIVQVGPTSRTFLAEQSFSEWPSQFVNQGDVIHMAAAIGGQNYEKIFTFDIDTLTLDTYSLPTPQARLTIAIVDNTLVTLGSDGLAYAVNLNDKNTWYTAPMDYGFLPTILTALKDRIVMIAGGQHYQFGHYSDEVLFINASVILESDVISLASPISNTTAPVDKRLTDGELAAAIVVPIVVAGLAVALVVVLLKRRKQRQTRRVGLDTRYGEWFVPFDQITFGEQIGHGGSGQVFKGKWKSSIVALKVSMTQANNSVITELELMMQLRPHPNVVQLLGFSVHPETNSIILIVQFCDGGSLDDKLFENNDEIPLQTRLHWLTGIARGLYHLHSSNIVHRDVAARNVLLDRSEPKLTDFGMSRVIDDQQQRGTTKSELGPIRWMSPESLKNKEYSTKSDIWSFGILMFEVIARHEPHNQADPISIGRQIRDEGLTPVIPSSCHPQLADLMKRCWQISPQSRPDIEEIILLLESVHSKTV